jgi:hypothetical protein
MLFSILEDMTSWYAKFKGFFFVLIIASISDSLEPTTDPDAAIAIQWNFLAH